MPPNPEPPPSDPARLAAVFVSYHCTEALLRNVSDILRQVEFAVVVDNGSPPASDATLRAIEALERTTVIRLGVNAGIAKALNVALQEVVDRGVEWVLTMDQDSAPGDDLARSLLADLGQAVGPVAIIAPLMLDASDSTTLIQGWVPPAEVGGRACPIDVCMTSGALTSTRFWARAGGFNEAYFIDYVDHEFCLRCHDLGGAVLQSFRAAIYHQLGKRESHRIGRRQYFATHHSAWRRYFITRNRLHLWRAFWPAHRPYIVKDMKAMAVETFKILVAEDQKLAKLGSMARGIAHALTGRPNLDRGA